MRAFPVRIVRYSIRRGARVPGMSQPGEEAGEWFADGTQTATLRSNRARPGAFAGAVLFSHSSGHRAGSHCAGYLEMAGAAEPAGEYAYAFDRRHHPRGS